MCACRRARQSHVGTPHAAVVWSPCNAMCADAYAVARFLWSKTSRCRQTCSRDFWLVHLITRASGLDFSDQAAKSLVGKFVLVRITPAQSQRRPRSVSRCSLFSAKSEFETTATDRKLRYPEPLREGEVRPDLGLHEVRAVAAMTAMRPCID